MTNYIGKLCRICLQEILENTEFHFLKDSELMLESKLLGFHPEIITTKLLEEWLYFRLRKFRVLYNVEGSSINMARRSKPPKITRDCNIDRCHLDLSFEPNPIVCFRCVDTINVVHEFKQMLIQTENAIKMLGQPNDLINQIKAENHSTVKVESPDDTSDYELHNLNVVKEDFVENPTELSMSAEESTDYYCYNCNYSTDNKENLILHASTHHKVTANRICTEKNIFRCGTCDFTTPQSSILISHKKSHGKTQSYKCNACNFFFISKLALNSHLCTNTVEGFVKPFKCYHCDFRAVYKSKLIMHLRRHAGDRPFKCTMCNFHSIERNKLKIHLRKHTGEKPFKCDLCSFRSIERSKLKIHLRKHTGEKPFKCERCSYSTAYKYSFKIHLRLHTGEKPFKCDQCDYCSSRNADLKLHMFKHTDKKPFKCDKCDYTSAYKKSLKIHLHTHTGEKPFKCDKCDYYTSRNSDLKRHMGRHLQNS